MRKVLGTVSRVETPGGPLAGTTVLDLGQTAVGPVAAMFLGYLGATVIKVEQPRGELGRYDVSRKHDAGFTFLSTNLGKFGVVLDARDPVDYGYTLGLVARADIVIDNFRSPDVMRRLGLDYFDVLRRVNPALVYIQSSSFQGRGPLRDLTSFEWVAQALSGFAGLTGHPDGKPQFSRGTAYLDWTAAMINTIAALAGLHRRRSSGEGVMLSTSQFGCSVFAGSARLAPCAAGPRAAARLGHNFGQTMLDRAFATADGHVAVCAPTPAAWRRFVHALGLPADTLLDPTGVELEPIIKARSSGDWVERFRAARLPTAAAHSASSLVDLLQREAQVQAEHLVQEHDPQRGGVLYAAPPWEMADRALGPLRAAPELGEHDELVKSIVQPIASPSARISSDAPSSTMYPLSRTKPLSGLAVVEIGTGLAVGTAGMVLAELGVSVTKVLPPWGDVAVAPAADAPAVERDLHGAKTIEKLDVGDRHDRRRLDDALRLASAVLVSGPMRFRRMFHLDVSDIRAVRGDVVYCGLTGFGTSGPLADAPATELDVQLMSGMTRQLGTLGEAPVRQGFHLVSVNTGYAAAQAVMAALLAIGAEERISVGGRHFEVSMLRTAVALGGWNLTAESGGDGAEGKQVQAPGWPPDHGYTCRDRQVLISIRNNDEGWVKFLAALDRVELLSDERFSTLEQLRANEWQLPGLLDEATRHLTSEQLRVIVEDSDGQMVPVLEPWEVMAHPQAVVQGLARPDGGVELPIDVVAS